MKKSEFKQLIKESVREVLVTEGFLSTIVAEVVKGVGTNVVTERVVEKQAPQESPRQSAKFQEERVEQKRKHLQETRKRMLDAIGKDSFSGVDVFEGTTPMKSGGTPGGPSAPNSALGDMEPTDPGVDISSLFGSAGTWKEMIK